MAARAARVDAAERGPAHDVLLRPALLSHIFKFAVRERKDVKLLHVHSAWDDTATNYCPWMWQRLCRSCAPVRS